MLADGAGEQSYFIASQSKSLLGDWIAAVGLVPDAKLKEKLYPSVRSLMFELPAGLASESQAAVHAQPGIKVEFYSTSPGNVAVETLDKLQPAASGVVPQIVMNVPQKKQDDAFALRFTGQLNVPQSGSYTFQLSSDDGSRLYLGGKLIIDHDGLHGFDAKSVTLNLNAGFTPLVLTYFDNGGGDGLELQWSGPGFALQPIAGDRLFVAGSSETLHDIAIRTLPSLPGHDAEKFLDLATLINAGRQRSSAISVLKTIPAEHWPSEGLDLLVDNLIGYISGLPLSQRNSPSAQEATTLVRAFAAKLPENRVKEVEGRLQNLDVRVIALATVVERMIYDKETIVVQAGKPVEFRITNPDNMPHNFVIVQPGALEEVGTLAEETGRQADAKDRQFVPKSSKILIASKLLETKQTQALTFEVPTEPGVYPFVCTYPGHWRRMFGALYVVADLEAYEANPEQYLAAHPLPVRDDMLKLLARNTEWKFDDLIGSVSPLPPGRSHEVGRNLFKVASCTACHKLGKEGQEIGPDLTKIEPMKQTTEHILRSLLEPSRDIAEKYQSNQFVLTSGKIVTGLVVEENGEAVKVLVDPMAKAPPVSLRKSEIEERVKSPVSIMPLGLLNKLTQEEVLDLVAYVYAKGEKKHKVYTAQPHKH
jgi:putative heme-binding domain-containing protein